MSERESSGEELIDEQGRNPTQQSLDEEGPPDSPSTKTGTRKETAMPEWDEVEGKAKEVEGKVTGDEDRELEGKAQGTWGEVKDTAGDVADTAGDAVDRARDKDD